MHQSLGKAVSVLMEYQEAMFPTPCYRQMQHVLLSMKAIGKRRQGPGVTSFLFLVPPGIASGPCSNSHIQVCPPFLPMHIVGFLPFQNKPLFTTLAQVISQYSGPCN